MAKWLEKTPKLPSVPQKSGNALAPQNRKPGASQRPQTLPNATIIYGIGASLLFAASVILLMAGKWLAAIGVFAIGACLTGFALHLLKHQD